MRLSFISRLAAVLGLLLLAGAGRAQTPALPTPAQPAFDVILRLDGSEIPGRVLLITPAELRYRPLPGGVAPTPDTLRLPVAEVFLVRYANGTREVLTRPASPAPALGDGRLEGLTAAQRQRLGQADALRHYKGRGIFWGSAGVFYLGLPGLLGVAIAAPQPVSPSQLRAPVPALLQDPDYGQGYQQQANRTRHHNVWAGYGTGAGILLGALAFSLVSVR